MLPLTFLLLFIAYLFTIGPAYKKMLSQYTHFSIIDEMPPKELCRKMFWIERIAAILMLTLVIATYWYLSHFKNQ